MEISSYKKQKGKESEMDMTPMIDVVFLLIIFFMLVTQFSNQKLEAGIKLPDASHSVEDDPAKRMVINIDREGKFYLMGIQHSKEALKRKIRAYGQMDKEDYKGMMLSTMKVMIRADKRTPYEHVQEIYYYLQEATIWKVCFATTREQES